MAQTIIIAIALSFAAYSFLSCIKIYPWRRRFVWRLAHYWSVVRLRRRVLILAVLTPTIIAGIYSLSARRFYGATARVEVYGNVEFGCRGVVGP
jgi:hypothetical protein